MATDANNLKLSYVTTAEATAFEKSVPSQGSINWRADKKRLTVGDGATAGGIEFLNATEAASKEEVGKVEETLAMKLTASDLETALSELIVEFGGTVPAD